MDTDFTIITAKGITDLYALRTRLDKKAVQTQLRRIFNAKDTDLIWMAVNQGIQMRVDLLSK